MRRRLNVKVHVPLMTFALCKQLYMITTNFHEHTYNCMYKLGVFDTFKFLGKSFCLAQNLGFLKEPSQCCDDSAVSLLFSTCIF